MTEERKAVKTLAEELVKAIYTAWEVSPPRYVAGGNNAGSISATRITGLPAVLPGILSQVLGSISGPTMPTDAVATQIITAIQNIAAGNFNTITVDTAMIERVYGTFAKFINLVAEDATIGDLDVENIRANLADIGLINIGSATITTAQIERASTGTLFVRDEIGGNVYIDDLAVSEANIVSLAAGEILLNDSKGDLVRLYVDATTHEVTTEPVSYDGNDVINTNSLNGNRIIQNSITTAQLNANEIFAYKGTIMNLIADNIEATRLFANQGFISALQTTLISSDLSQNQTIISLGDEINLMASNVGRTYVQSSAPLPKSSGDTWFNPLLEEHYVSTGVIVPQMDFAHDADGYLCNLQTEDYQFQIDSNGRLMLLPVSEEAQRVITDNNIDFSIVDNCVYTDKVWKKVENVAFANLKVSVDGIVSEVYDSQTGLSRIQQNTDRIQLTVNDVSNVTNGTTPIPYVKTNTSSIEIKNNKVAITSSGDVDIKANKFVIAFNTDGNLYDKSRVEISDSNGIKVSNQYGGYFQATYNKLGLYDILGNAKLEMRSDGDAYFSGKLDAASGTFSGTLDAACITTGTISSNLIGDNSIAVGKLTGLIQNNGWQLNLTNGTFTIGNLDASKINAGYINVERINTNSITVEKLTGTISNNGWELNLTNGTFSIGNISANNITSGTISASIISGGTLNVGGTTNGSIVVKNSIGDEIVTINQYGITMSEGEISSSSGNYWDLSNDILHIDSAIIGPFSLNEYGFRFEDIEHSKKIEIGKGSNSPVIVIGNRSNGFSGIEISSDAISWTDENGRSTVKLWGGHFETVDESYDYFIIYNTVNQQRNSILEYRSDDNIINTCPLKVNGTLLCVDTQPPSYRTIGGSNLYCYGTTQASFGDFGESIIGQAGSKTIYIRGLSAYAVDNEMVNYQVFLQPYGDGICYVQSRGIDQFEVKGTAGLSFGWVVMSKDSRR